MFLCFFMYVHDVMIFDDLYVYFLFYIYIFLYKILTVFDRCAYRGLSFWVRFYNIIIHYIISCYLSLAFVGDVCGIFVGCAISLATDIPFCTIYLHISAVFACFWHFDGEYICIYPCVSISYEDSSTSFHILATKMVGMTREEEE